MAAGDGVFNVSLGMWRYYLGLPAANDALVAVLLKSAGLVAEATLKDYTTLADLLAGASDEADFTGYTRLTITAGITITPDNANERVDGDMPDFEWAAAVRVTNNSLGKLLVCYDPDTTGGTDASLIPVTYHNFVTTTDDNGLLARISAAGFVRAAAA